MITGSVEVREFQEFTREAVKELSPDEQLKALRAIGLKFIGEVVPRTPVDTGQARGAWTAMKGSSRTVQIGGQPGGAAQGRRQGKYSETKRGTEVGIEIFNGVPHIVYLELGSSRQAPSGMVRLTLREMSGKLVNDLRKDTFRALSRANDRARLKYGLRQGGRYLSADTLRGRGLI